MSVVLQSAETMSATEVAAVLQRTMKAVKMKNFPGVWFNPTVK